MPLYCLDSDVFIQAAQNYYAFDVAPGFWHSLEALANTGIIISPSIVLDELSKGNDELSRWAKLHKGTLFSVPDEKIVNEFQQIADYVNKHYEQHQSRIFLSGADPWVIAQAKAYNLIVVTMESRNIEELNKKTGLYKGRIKIPNVCNRFGVKSITTFELLRTQKIHIG